MPQILFRAIFLRFMKVWKTKNLALNSFIVRSVAVRSTPENFKDINHGLSLQNTNFCKSEAWFVFPEFRNIVFDMFIHSFIFLTIYIRVTIEHNIGIRIFRSGLYQSIRYWSWEVEFLNFRKIEVKFELQNFKINFEVWKASLLFSYRYSDPFPLVTNLIKMPCIPFFRREFQKVSNSSEFWNFQCNFP